MKTRLDDKGNPNGCYELTEEELSELNLCDLTTADFEAVKEGTSTKNVKVVLSGEFLQDMEFYLKSLFSVKTGDISDEEWDEWSEHDDILEQVFRAEDRSKRFDEVRRILHFENKEIPYDMTYEEYREAIERHHENRRRFEEWHKNFKAERGIND